MRATLFVLALAAPAMAQQLPADRLAAIKDATVLIKVNTPTGAYTGSGFVVRRTDTTSAYVATNFHVVCPKRGHARRPGEAHDAEVRVATS